jgi:hypothetical protein
MLPGISVGSPSVPAPVVVDVTTIPASRRDEATRATAIPNIALFVLNIPSSMCSGFRSGHVPAPESRDPI